MEGFTDERCLAKTLSPREIESVLTSQAKHSRVSKNGADEKAGDEEIPF